MYKLCAIGYNTVIRTIVHDVINQYVSRSVVTCCVGSINCQTCYSLQTRPLHTTVSLTATRASKTKKKIVSIQLIILTVFRYPCFVILTAILLNTVLLLNKNIKLVCKMIILVYQFCQISDFCQFSGSFFMLVVTPRIFLFFL